MVLQDVHVLHPDDGVDRWSLGTAPVDEDTSAGEFVAVILFAFILLFIFKMTRKCVS